MIEVKIYNDISSEDVLMLFGNVSDVFSAEKLKDIFAAYPNERDFRFNINCNGGSVREGFAIYDIMRTSGKNIYCNIDGACHSMAIVVLLAAPAKNRTANPNATALMHDVRAWAGDVTADSAALLAADLKRERGRILDVYAERTKINRALLEKIMLEEKERSAGELLSWGFISQINSYNTNKKTTKIMNKKKRNFSDFINSLGSFIKSSQSLNYAFTDVDGNVLFETEKDDETLAVGDTASPDGVFELPDGRTVTVEGGVISEITEADEATVEELRNEIANLSARLEQAVNLLAEAHGYISNLAETRSKYNVKPRTGIIEKTSAKTSAEIKDEIRKNLGKKPVIA